MSTPVSGPGQFSARTDKAVSDAGRALPNAQYGENKDYQDQKSGAAMAQGQGQDVTGMNFNDLFGNPASRVTGLGEASAQPGTPVTDGAAEGAGAGTEALTGPQSSDNQNMAAYLVALEFMANQPGSSDSARNLVRQMKSQL